MKKLFACIVVCIFMLVLVSCDWIHTMRYRDLTNGLEYSLNSDNESYSIVRVYAFWRLQDRAIAINDTYNGLPVTSIGELAFAMTNLTSATIPNSVMSIGNHAFSHCDSLTSVTIPDSVTSIGNSAFSNCENLTSITVDEDNEYYKSIDGNLYTKDGKTLIQYAEGKTDTSFTIPDSVTSIGDSAFFGCGSLTSVTIPDSVTSIGSSAFFGCGSLTSVVIPDSVTSIGDYAFSYCDSLTIYCEAESQPDGWSSSWNSSGCPIVWGYTADAE